MCHDLRDFRNMRLEDAPKEGGGGKTKKGKKGKKGKK